MQQGCSNTVPPPYLRHVGFTGPKGGLGTKFERAIVSEVVGINAVFGIKTSSRIDPLIVHTKNIKVYKTSDGWTLEEKLAEKDAKAKPSIRREGQNF